MQDFCTFGVILGGGFIWGGYLAIQQQNKITEEMSKSESRKVGEVMILAGILSLLSTFMPMTIQNGLRFMMIILGIWIVYFYRSTSSKR